MQPTRSDREVAVQREKYKDWEQLKLLLITGTSRLLILKEEIAGYSGAHMKPITMLYSVDNTQRSFSVRTGDTWV
jgi:hypothetical protein